ncbi:MAG: transporter substrate-binding domain-containing protein [Rhodoferax sp.]|nr:transporter substrate-binding domain-containing protein [Rhodoferax sp.]
MKKYLPTAALAAVLVIALSGCSKPTDAPAILATAASAPAPAIAPDLKVAIDPTYEPFSFKTADGKPTGFDIGIALAICAEIKRNCVFVEQVWDSMIPGLMAKKYDVIISSMGITEERLAQIDFSDRYYNTPSRIIVKKGTAYDSPASLKGKRIGVGKSTIQEKYAMGELVPAGVRVVPYDAQDQVYLDIKAGRLDGTVADYVEVLGGFLSKPEGANYQAVGPDLYEPKYFGIGVGIGMRKGQDALKAELNAAIKAIRANGTYKTINDTYFGKFGIDVWGK